MANNPAAALGSDRTVFAGQAARGANLFTCYSPAVHVFFTQARQSRGVRHRRLHRLVTRFGGLATRSAAPAAVLLLGFLAVGCTSHRPVALHVDRRPGITTPAGLDGRLSLKLVTYNVWGLPGWMTGARSGRYPQIARELERLDPDVALLQEAWTAKARRSAPKAGPWSVARAAGQHVFFQQNGLVTLSKFPILGGQFYPFSRAAFPDRFVHKGALKVTLQLPGGEVLNVWNVHLQDGGPPQVQRSQVRELIGHVLAAQDGQTADLVGGDFNCTPESALYRELEAGLGRSAVQLAGVPPFATWDGLSTKPGRGTGPGPSFHPPAPAAENLSASPPGGIRRPGAAPATL